MAVKKIEQYNKHENPATNENQFDVENYLNANWDKTLEIVDNNADELILAQKDIEQLQQNDRQQDINIETLQKENIELKEKNNKLKNALLNAETEEAKSLYVEDANKFGNLEVLGNHEQETRSGKNLLDFSGLSTQTVNGLTITNNNDGSITLNGTTTDIVSMKLSRTMYNLAAGNYYLSRNSSGTASRTFTNILYGNNGTAVNVANLVSEGMPLTTTTDYEQYYLWLYIGSGITFTNYTIKPQLEAGTVKTDWEQYGAMPSPNYPSEVVCLGSNKNLFDDSEYKGVKIETSFKNNSIPITLDGEGYYNSKVYFTDGTVIEAGDWNMPISLQDEEYNQVVGLRPQTATLITKEQIANIKNARLIYNATGISTYQGKIIKGIKIEKQETENASPTSYSPYGQGSTKISKINKNLYDKDNIQLYNNNDSAFENTANDNSIRLRTSSFKLRTGSYILSGVPSGISLTAVRAYDINKALVTGGAVRNVNKFTLQKGIEYIYLLFSKNNGSDITADEIANADLMIEKGDAETSYVEHEQTDYILDIQQEMLKGDKFVKETDGWKEVHGWDVYEITGNENWRKHATTSNNAFYFEGYAILANAETPINSNQEIATIINNYFKTYAVDTIAQNDIVGTGLAVNTAYYIGTGLDGISTLEEFKAKLQELYNAGTPIKFYYKLKTPTKLLCTAEQSAVLEELSNLELFDGVNNIITAEDIALLKLKYALDVETYVDNKIDEKLANINAQILNIAGGN